MNKFIDSLLFSFFVSISMVMLDALYHLATETTVHVNYVLVKITIIFLILFLTSFWIGKGKHEGIFACISGPIIFYIYYLFADPTLNRAVFKIDDSFGYIFLHIFVFAISYLIMYNFLVLKKGSREIKTTGLAFIMALTTLGIDSFYRLGKVRLTTKNEELVAKVMSFPESLYLILFLIVIYFLIFYYIKNQKIEMISYLIGSIFGIYLIGQDISRVFFGVTSIIPLILMSYYLNNIDNKLINQENKIISKSKNKQTIDTAFFISSIILSIIGVIYTFLNYKTIKILKIGFGLRHNDHVMIGIIALTIAIVSFYRYLRYSSKLF